MHTIHEGAAAPVGVKEEERTSVRIKFGLARPYFYYPAMLAPHKGHGQLLAAFHAFHKKHCEFELILTGAHAHRFPVLEREIIRLGLQNSVRHLGYLDAREVAALLSGATALVYPSFYEGFGLPLLEAMSLGTPVISSLHGSLPEVAGDAALLIEPNDQAQTVAALEAACWDNDLRKSLREKGYLRVRHFSWNRCAAETVTLFRKAAN